MYFEKLFVNFKLKIKNVNKLIQNYLNLIELFKLFNSESGLIWIQNNSNSKWNEQVIKKWIVLEMIKYDNYYNS